MRVTNAMMAKLAIRDLERLRNQYHQAQSAVLGRALERPSEDPTRVVEAMDLAGAKLRLERAIRSGQDAREWLTMAEDSLSAMIDHLHAARETVLQAGGPGSLDADAREAMAVALEAIREALLRELNTRHRDQYLFAGWNTETKPFADDGTYVAASSGEILRDIAPGLSVAINIPGDRLKGQEMIENLQQMADDLRAGNVAAVVGEGLARLDEHFGNLTVLRSDLGVRMKQVERYEELAQDGLMTIERRIGEITGTDIERAVLEMTQAQSAYQAALASFSKALPVSLLDYMLR